MRALILGLALASLLASCAMAPVRDVPDLKPVDAINANKLTPSCSQSTLLLPVGYNLNEYPGEIAYYTTIQAACNGTAVVIAEEHGRATHDKNGASLRVFIGPAGLEPVRELCRRNDGDIAPAGTRPPTPSGYWSKQGAFSTYDLACRTSNNDYVPVPITKGEVTQFTFLRWNENAQPWDPVSSNVILHVVFQPAKP